MKKTTLLITLLFACLGAAAQTVTIGTGTSTNYKGPITSFWDYGATEMIYLGSELNTTGNITSIGWYVATASTLPCDPVYIYMKTTSATTLASSTASYPASTAGYTLVYTGTGHDEVTGWQSIELDTPFPFTDTNQNLSILCVNLTGDYFEQYPEYRYTLTTGSYQCAVYYSNTLWVDGASNLTPSYERYNVQVGFTPIEGDEPTISSISPLAGCPGASVTITGTNFTGATAVTIGDEAVTSFTVDSGTQITAIVNADSDGEVEVTTPDGSAAGDDDFSVTLVPAPMLPDDAPIVCNATTLMDLAGDLDLVWYDAEDGGNVVEDDAEIFMDGVYYAAQVMDGCESTERTTVNISMIVVEEPEAEAVQNFCGLATVFDLVSSNATYWYADSDGGEPLASDTVLENLETYYASQVIDGCESIDRRQVEVIITIPYVDTLDDVDTCSTYTLAALENGDYFTEPNGDGMMLEAGDVISEDMTIYIFNDDFSAPDCTAESFFNVTVTPIDGPTGDSVQVITVEQGEDANLADFMITIPGNGTITWYATLEDAESGENSIGTDTVVADGEDYYATYTAGDCVSNPAMFTADVLLGRNGFDNSGFMYYPNPVGNVFNISSVTNISAVKVFNMLGQEVMSAQPDTLEVKLNMTSLPDATYVVNVTSGDSVKTIKVVKKQ